MEIIIIVLAIALVPTILINLSLSKENKSLKRDLEWKKESDHRAEHSQWTELINIKSELRILQRDRVTNTVYAFVAFCQHQYYVGIIKEANNSREAYGYAHEKVKEKFGTDDMVLDVITLWIPGINQPVEEVENGQ